MTTTNSTVEHPLTSFVDLSVIVPAYNEEHRLMPTLERLHAFLSAQPLRYEILVVDDGSKDDTCGVVERAMTSVANLQLVRQMPNQGKGAAVRRGMLSARGQIRVMCDAGEESAKAECITISPQSFHFVVVREISSVDDREITTLNMYGEHSRKSKNIWHTRGLEPDDSLLSLSAGFARCRMNKTTFLQNVCVNRSYIQVLDAFFDARKPNPSSENGNVTTFCSGRRFFDVFSVS